MGAFAEMSGDVSRICDIIAHDLARTHIFSRPPPSVGGDWI